MTKKEKWLVLGFMAALTASVAYDATVMMSHGKKMNDSEYSINCQHDLRPDSTACLKNPDGRLAYTNH